MSLNMPYFKLRGSLKESLLIQSERRSSDADNLQSLLPVQCLLLRASCGKSDQIHPHQDQFRQSSTKYSPLYRAEDTVFLPDPPLSVSHGLRVETFSTRHGISFDLLG